MLLHGKTLGILLTFVYVGRRNFDIRRTSIASFASFILCYFLSQNTHGKTLRRGKLMGNETKLKVFSRWGNV